MKASKEGYFTSMPLDNRSDRRNLESLQVPGTKAGFKGSA